MNKQTNLNKARNHCANWSNGNCMGAMIRVKRKKGKKPLLCQWIDKQKEGRRCTVNNGCSYFNNLVVPAISILP